jgi:hypothetical protein
MEVCHPRTIHGSHIHSCQLSIISNGEARPVLNMSLTEGLGLLTTRGIMTLEKVRNLVRNQHIRDTRPNKRLDPQINDYLYRGSNHHALMVKVASEGFGPVFRHPRTTAQRSIGQP